MSLRVLSVGAAAALMVEYAVRNEITRAMAGEVPREGPIALTVLAVTVFGAAVVLSLAQRQIFRPLNRLADAMRHREAGEFGVHLGWMRADELGVLGRAFDSMADSLDGHRMEVERFAAYAATALAAAVDAKDPYTHDHSRQVAAFAAYVGGQLGLPTERVERLRTAAVRHDVGKISISDAILLKPGRLTDVELEVMKGHSASGEQIVRAAGMSDIAPWVRHHHERYGGGGYPDGLIGESIPLEARIIGACDALEAMTSSRSYRDALALDDALLELERCSGTQFDPDVVRLLVGMRPRPVVAGDDGTHLAASAQG